MKHSQSCCQTPPTVTVHMQSSASRSHKPKKAFSLKRPKFKDSQETSRKNTDNTNKSKQPKGSCLVIQRQEMTAFFKLFGRFLNSAISWILTTVLSFTLQSFHRDARTPLCQGNPLQLAEWIHRIQSDMFEATLMFQLVSRVLFCETGVLYPHFWSLK